MKPLDTSDEAYELHNATSSPRPDLTGEVDAEEPLLPRYERHPAPLSKSQLTYRTTRTTRGARLKRALACLCVSLLIIIPTMGLAGCWVGRDTLEKVRQWDKIPPEWKEWLESNVPLGKPAADPGHFPTDLGYAGPTPTGSEAALVATAPALPLFTGIAPLVPPSTKTKHSFNILHSWGNLSPYHSVESHGLSESSSLIPESCELEELHWLQRHGARYPTTQADGPAGIAARLKSASGWKAKGDLEWLNDWSYKLGAEVLTPFGRQQLFNLGVAARLKYGFLLDKMPGRLPVFRTETQDRMLKSAQNFAAGFFGYPAEEQYNLEVMIESPGFNCTLAPWNACKIRNDTSYSIAFQEMAKWDAVFLKDAHERISDMMDGYDVSLRDVKDFMEMCAYETVALGYSSFCNLFTQREWKGFEYRNDIYWWYTSSFGYPQARAQGKGWAQELLSRLTHTRLTTFDSTTNSSFHNDIHFPLRDPLYVDFTHDTQFALLLPTLNLTSFSESGPPPTDHIPKHWSFEASKFCPFATNLQVQVLSCGKKSSSTSRQIRIILNDAPVPLNGINGCGEDEEGLCAFDTFVEGVKQLVDEVDFAEACDGNASEQGDEPGVDSEGEVGQEESEEEMEQAAEEAVAGDQTEVEVTEGEEVTGSEDGSEDESSE